MLQGSGLSDEEIVQDISTGLFDSDADLFHNTFLITSTCAVSGVVLGLFYEIMRRIRKRQKVQYDNSKWLTVLYIFTLLLIFYTFLRLIWKLGFDLCHTILCYHYFNVINGEALLYHISKYTLTGVEIRWQRMIFDELQSVCKYGKTLSWLFCMSFRSGLQSRSKRRKKVIKIYAYEWIFKNRCLIS